MKEVNIDNINGLQTAISKLGSDCVGIVYGRRCLPDQKKWIQTYSKLAPNILRPVQVRAIAYEFIQQVMNGE